MWKVMWLGFFLLGSPLVAQAKRDVFAEETYFKARKLFEGKKFKEARPLFAKLLELLRAKKAKETDTRKRHFLTLGQCDLLFHQGRILEALGQRWKACHRFERLRILLETVPKGWQQWRINRLLPERFVLAKERHKQCETVLSRLEVTGLPKGAKVSRKQLSADGKTTSWQPLKLPLKVKAGKLTLRFEAPGYESKEETVTVPRWGLAREEISLKKTPQKAPPRRRPDLRRRREPPPKKPKGLSPWAWAGIAGGGALLAGGVVLAVVLANQRTDRVQPVIRSVGGQPVP